MQLRFRPRSLCSGILLFVHIYVRSVPLLLHAAPADQCASPLPPYFIAFPSVSMLTIILAFFHAIFWHWVPNFLPSIFTFSILLTFMAHSLCPLSSLVSNFTACLFPAFPSTPQFLQQHRLPDAQTANSTSFPPLCFLLKPNRLGKLQVCNHVSLQAGVAAYGTKPV